VEYFVRSCLNNIPPEKFATIMSKVESLPAPKVSKYQNLCLKYYESNIPIEYWDISIEKDFKGNKKIPQIYKEYIGNGQDNLYVGKSFYIAGTHGIGKTFLLTSILKTMAIRNHSCLYTTLGAIVNTLTSAPNSDRYQAGVELNKVSFLAIDEFDQRFVLSNAAADLYMSILESILRVRLQNRLPTLIATNSPNILESFSGSLKESLVSLFNRLDKYMVMDEDYRKKHVERKTSS